MSDLTSTVPKTPTVGPKPPSLPKPGSPAEVTRESAATGTTRVFARNVKLDGTQVTSTVADFGSGKDGKMSNAAAIAFLARLYQMISASEDARVQDLEPHEQEAFRGAVYCFLALNTGAVNSVDGFGSGTESETYLHFGGKSVRASDIRVELGSDAYRFMRARATQIAQTLLLQIQRARDPAGRYPNATEVAHDLEVVAAKRGLTEYPHLAFVGAEYVTGITIRQRAVIFEAGANILGGRVNVREDTRTRAMAASRST